MIYMHYHLAFLCIHTEHISIYIVDLSVEKLSVAIGFRARLMKQFVASIVEVRLRRIWLQFMAHRHAVLLLTFSLPVTYGHFRLWPVVQLLLFYVKDLF